MLPLSAQDVCFCASFDGCGGGEITTPWMHIQRQGAVTGGQYHGTGPFGAALCSDYSLPHCHHHGPQGDDPFPPEGAAGCPSERSPACPRKCDADAAPTHSDWGADKVSFSGRIQHASGMPETAPNKTPPTTDNLTHACWQCAAASSCPPHPRHLSTPSHSPGCDPADDHVSHPSGPPRVRLRSSR